MQHVTSAAFQAATFLGADGGPALNTSGITEWAIKNILPLLLLVIGLFMVAGSRKGQLSQNAGIITNAMIGLGLIASAGVLYVFAGSITQLIFGA